MSVVIAVLVILVLFFTPLGYLVLPVALAAAVLYGLLMAIAGIWASASAVATTARIDSPARQAMRMLRWDMQSRPLYWASIVLTTTAVATSVCAAVGVQGWIAVGLGSLFAVGVLLTLSAPIIGGELKRLCGRWQGSNGTFVTGIEDGQFVMRRGSKARHVLFNRSRRSLVDAATGVELAVFSYDGQALVYREHEYRRTESSVDGVARDMNDA